MKHADFPSSLLIRDFPEVFSRKCLSSSGEKVLTRAVMRCLEDYFRLKKQYAALKVKKQDLESDVDQIKAYFRLESDVAARREAVLKLISDPNRFYLHGD